MKTFADAELVLAANLPGYAPRPQQQRLAVGVEAIFASDTYEQLLAQAGCGVGKSLGTLIPAILSGKRLIIATATKALQEQYAGKDMPFLEEFLGIDFTWALLKGRSNYVCAAKLAEVTADQLPGIEAIREELSDFAGKSGDFEHLENQVPETSKYLLSMSSVECPGKDECPFAQQCFAEKAKAEAKAAQVVITNTAMLMTDLKIRQISDGKAQMLGEYEGVAIDEAHELPEIAAGALADQFRRKGLELILKGAENFIGEQGGDDVAKLAGGLRDNIEQVWNHLDELAKGEQVELKISELADHIEPYIELIEGLKKLEMDVSKTQIRNGHPIHEATRQRRIARRIISAVERLTEFVVSEGLVRWIETEEVGRGRNRRSVTTLKYSPIEVGDFLNEMLWSQVPAVLVSATLSVNGKFDYIAETLGLDNPATLDVGTPFDYGTQALTFVPDKNQPDPSRDRSRWVSYAQQTTRELVQAAGGGALLLYTSRRAMKDAYELLSPVLEMAGFTCLMQGEHGTNKEIAARFQDDTHSVLFALKSFFTGVDFAGETCRLVVIDKLPFPVPSDILFAARADLINRRHGDSWASFNHLSVPMMTLVLIQGFGRLIRSLSDRGVVAILDPRLSSKSYGRKIVRSLPPAPVTNDMAAVTGFFAA